MVEPGDEMQMGLVGGRWCRVPKRVREEMSLMERETKSAEEPFNCSMAVCRWLLRYSVPMTIRPRCMTPVNQSVSQYIHRVGVINIPADLSQ